MNRQDNIEQFEQYLSRRSDKDRTAMNYVSDIRQFASHCAKAWREVTMHDIDEFIDQQRQKGRSAATIKRRVVALKIFFDFLAEEADDLAWQNPVRNRRHAIKLPKRLPRDLSNDALERLWSVIDKVRDRAWYVLMLRAGLRVGEVVSLKVDDLLRLPVNDQPAQIRVCGKGQKERMVLLTADAYAVVDAWRQVRPTSAEPFLFLNERGQPLRVNGIEWLLRHYGEQAGISVTPHQLRHSFARQVTEAGMPISSLSKLLGHEQISTTQIYTAGADPALAQAYTQAMTQPIRPAQPLIKTSLPAEPLRPLLDVPPATPAPVPTLDGWELHFPSAIRQACLTYTQQQIPTWKPQYRRQRTQALLYRFQAFWTWQLTQRPVTAFEQITLHDLRRFQQAELARNLAAASINRLLDPILAVLRLRAEQELPVDPSVFRLRPLPRPQRLPRCLPPNELQALENHLLARLNTADPDLKLENACYFVLAHSGLRISECIDLRFSDLDLNAKRLLIRQAKGQRDRIVYLSDTACHSLLVYLDGQMRTPSSVLWSTLNGKPLSYQSLYLRITALGDAVGISHLTPHRLRHSFATRLINAGMDISRIQKLLGHEYLSTTQIYAFVQDKTVEADYRIAMRSLDFQQMPLSNQPIPVASWPIPLTTCDSIPILHFESIQI